MQTNRPLTVVALMLAMFMAAMEMTVVSTAMPTAVADLGGISLYSWVFTAYMLTSTVTVPIYGKLADLYGRKPVILFGIVLFLIGSMASGQAHTMTQLIAFRALQGLGAGAMQPIALTIIGDIFTLEQRAKMQGVFGAVWGLAGLIGPLLGGVIVKLLSWRWIFYVNVPFGLLSGAILVFSLRETVELKARKLDVMGALVLSIAVIAMLIGAQGFHPIALLSAAACALVLFVVVERRAEDPMLPLDLFTTRIMAVASATSALTGGAMIALTTYVPLFVQGVSGGSPTDAGLAIAPMAIGWPIASAISGRMIPRYGFRVFVRLGLLVTTLASLALPLTMGSDVHPWTLRAISATFGVGMGLANTALIIAVQTSVSWKQRGVATASMMFFRTIGSTLAVGAMGGVLAAAFAGAVSDELANKILGPERRTIDPGLLRGIAGTLQGGLSTVFWIIAALCVVAFVISLFFPNVPASEASLAPAQEVAPPAAEASGG